MKKFFMPSDSDVSRSEEEGRIERVKMSVVRGEMGIWRQGG